VDLCDSVSALPLGCAGNAGYLEPNSLDAAQALVDAPAVGNAITSVTQHYASDMLIVENT
jgi:hypothetical protein